MRTIVDRTTEALSVEVCSVYLMDRDTARLHLAATNGLDRDQIGRVTLAVGEGITGGAAASGQPIASPDVRADPRFKWVPRLRPRRFTSMLSVPLPWNDSIIGVLNVQTDRDAAVLAARRSSSWSRSGRSSAASSRRAGSRPRRSSSSRRSPPSTGPGPSCWPWSRTSCARRWPSCGPTWTCWPTRADRATGEAPAAARSPTTGATRPIDQVTRLDRLVDSILASVRGEGLAAARPRRRSTSARAVGETIDALPPLLRGHPLRWERRRRTPLSRHRRRGALPPGPGAPARERGQVRAARAGASPWAPGGRRRGPGLRHRRRPRHPDEEWESVFEAYVRSAPSGRAAPGSGFTRRGGSWTRWAAASGSRATATAAAGSWLRCPAARRSRR